MRVGIAGSGFMARAHAQAYVEMGIQVVGVTSPSGPKKFIEEFGFDADVYTDVERMCNRTDIDYLDICTPTHTHLDLVRTASKTDTDMFIEKPIAGTLEEAHNIAELVDEAELTCMVGHVVRFSPGYVEAPDLDVGQPGVARARRLSPLPDWGSGDWFADRKKSGGIFVDLAIHDLDHLRWCWGPIQRVFARHRREDRSEHGFVTLRFENGAVGYVEVSWAQPDSRPLTYELELAGDDGLIEFSSENELAYREWCDDETLVESPHMRDGYRRELEHFVSCLESGSEPAVGVTEGIRSLQLALAAERSARTGKPVAPREVSP